MSRQAGEAQLKKLLQQEAKLETYNHSINPHEAEHTTMRQLVAKTEQDLLKHKLLTKQLADKEAVWQQVHKAFKREGIQSFALEGVLSELEV